MTDDKPDATDEGAGALPLAPVVDMGSWYGEADLADLPMLAPSPLPAIDRAALGDILADSLFGEVIEISDLIPQLLEPGMEQAVVPVSTPAEPGATGMDGDVFVASLPFTILFEDDGSSGQGML